MQVLDVALVELDLGQRGGDLGVREHAGGLPLGQEQLYLFELLKFAYRHPYPVTSEQGPGTRLGRFKQTLRIIKLSLYEVNGANRAIRVDLPVSQSFFYPLSPISIRAFRAPVAH